MATREYDEANTTRINLKLNNKTDTDIIEKLSQVDNVQGFIKALIRNDLEGATTMKNFKQITNKPYGALESGYAFNPRASLEKDEQLFRKLSAERGRRFVEDKLDTFDEFSGDLYEDENGAPYAVEFVYDGDRYVPLFWQELIEARYHIKPEFLDRFGSDATEDFIVDHQFLDMVSRGWETPIHDIIPMLDLIC